MNIASNLLSGTAQAVGAQQPSEAASEPMATVPETARQVIAYPEAIRLEPGQLVQLFDTSAQLIDRRWVQVPLSSIASDQGYLTIEIQRSDGSFAVLYQIGPGGGEFHTANGAKLFARATNGPVSLIAAEERY